MSDNWKNKSGKTWKMVEFNFKLNDQMIFYWSTQGGEIDAGHAGLGKNLSWQIGDWADISKKLLRLRALG